MIRLISYIKNVLIALIVAYALNISTIIKLSFGIEKFPDDIFFWFIPTLILLLIYFKDLTFFKNKNFFFLFICLLILIGESSFFRDIYFISNNTYLIGFIKFYMIYEILNITSHSTQIHEFLIKVSLVIVWLIILYFYFDFFISSGNVFSVISSSRYLDFGFHPNGLSVVCLFGLYINYILFERKSISKYLFLFSSIVIITVVLLCSTRGVFLIILISSTFILYFNYSKSKLINKFLIICSFIIFSYIIIYFQSSLIANIFIVERLIDAETGGIGRYSQLLANLENFYANPIFGVGYEKAGLSWIYNSEVSNVHYTQMLAAYGVFTSIIYFSFLFNLVKKFKIKFSLIILFTMFVVFGSYNYTLILPVSLMLFLNNNLNQILATDEK